MKAELRDGRQQRLVHCAKKAFASSGYYETSISQIVQQAGIARATFYQHFDNKLHIFQSILDSFLQNLHDSIRPITLGPEAPSPLTQIQDNLTRVLDLVLRERDLTQILLHHTSTSDRTVEKRVNGFYRQVAEMIERSLNLGIAMNLVRPCNARLTAYSIIGAVKEVVLQLTSSQESQPPVEELMEELLEFGMGGILAESQAHLLESTYRPGRASFAPGPSDRPHATHMSSVQGRSP